jgi:hypothetical protein
MVFLDRSQFSRTGGLIRILYGFPARGEGWYYSGCRVSYGRQPTHGKR